jgi:hypothetical protein
VAKELAELMGGDLFDLFSCDYFHLVYGDGCQRGYGKYLESHVNKLVEWDTKHKHEMNIFLDKHPTHRLSTQYKEFREMFIGTSVLEQGRVFNIAESLDVGPMIAMAGHARSSNLYRMWKSGYTPPANQPRKDECVIC